MSSPPPLPPPAMSFGARDTPVTRQGPRVPDSESQRAIEELAGWIDEEPDAVARSLGYNPPPLKVAPAPMPVIKTGQMKMIARPMREDEPIPMPEVPDSLKSSAILT